MDKTEIDAVDSGFKKVFADGYQKGYKDALEMVGETVRLMAKKQEVFNAVKWVNLREE